MEFHGNRCGDLYKSKYSISSSVIQVNDFFHSTLEFHTLYIKKHRPLQPGRYRFNSPEPRRELRIRSSPEGCRLRALPFIASGISLLPLRRRCLCFSSPLFDRPGAVHIPL